ncbi:hypothetical protein GCM10010415_25620 [Streptomyces atrovirens]
MLDVRGKLHHGVQRQGVGHHLAVGEDDALGLAGGAGGVDDGQRVLGAGGGPVSMMVGSAPETAAETTRARGAGP